MDLIIPIVDIDTILYSKSLDDSTLLIFENK